LVNEWSRAAGKARDVENSRIPITSSSLHPADRYLQLNLNGCFRNITGRRSNKFRSKAAAEALTKVDKARGYPVRKTAACKLGWYCGNFMNANLIGQAWPKMSQLLNAVKLFKLVVRRFNRLQRLW
jgi:hypothetical protein